MEIDGWNNQGALRVGARFTSIQDTDGTTHAVYLQIKNDRNDVYDEPQLYDWRIEGARSGAMTLFRPVGLEELPLLYRSGLTRFPPRYRPGT